jgi:hypothetical protein
MRIFDTGTQGIMQIKMNPSNPLARHSGEGRNPARTNTREADKIKALPSFRASFFINGIPAFAGMTRFSAHKQFGMNVLKKAGFDIGLPVLAVLLLTHCGGGRSGAAIHAYPQTITFGAAPALTLHGTGTVSATASSGLALSYSSTTPTVCSVDTISGLVTNITSGNCIIAADQAGDTNYAPAPQVTQTISLAIDPNQTITFGTAPSLTLYGHGVVSATASSGLAASFSSTTPTVCTVNGSTGEVSDLATGDCIIAADQAGDTNHYAAPRVTQTITIAAWTWPITIPDAPGGVAATADNTPNTVTVSFMQSVSSGGSPVTAYRVTSTPPGMTATGAASPITLTCPSTCTGYAFSVGATNGTGNSLESALANVLTNYAVTETFYEPDTQPNNSIFTGTFTLDSTNGAVSNLKGYLTESMTGPPMSKVPLTYQLSAVPDGLGGLLVTTFALNTTNTFSEGGFASGSQGLYYGFPTSTNPAAGGIGNSFVTIYVNLTNPTAMPTTTQINQLAYGDCAAGGMMGSTCMTAYSGAGTMGGYPVSQTITMP